MSDMRNPYIQRYGRSDCSECMEARPMPYSMPNNRMRYEKPCRMEPQQMMAQPCEQCGSPVMAEMEANCKGKESCDQKRSMQAVYELGFIMVETALFLDTHPNDMEALAYYADMKEKYHEAVKFYNENFGPLDFFHVTNENYWSWVATPMPWEVEG